MARIDRRTNPTAEAPLLEHLEELRTRLLISIAYLLVGAVVAWNYKEDLIRLFRLPLAGVRVPVQVVTQNLTDQLVIAFTVALWGGLVLALPFMLHQLWRFIEPGLTSTEKHWAIPFILGAAFSFALGSAFCFYVVLPAAVPFLVGFLGPGAGITALLNLASYIGTVVTYLLIFGLIFQLPILALILTKIGLISAPLLVAVRRYAIVVLMVLAAVLTPTPDPFNMLLMAGPMYLLYELSIIISRLAAPKPRQEAQGYGQEELEI